MTTTSDVEALGTVLGVWAHPDDEAFLTAGLMLLARRAGNRVPALPLVVLAALVIFGLQLASSYHRIESVFKWLTLALFAYIGSAFFARPDWGEVVAATFVPTVRFDQTFLLTLVAILGTTISPYLFFWQATQEVEEEAGRGGQDAAAVPHHEHVAGQGQARHHEGV